MKRFFWITLYIAIFLFPSTIFAQYVPTCTPCDCPQPPPGCGSPPGSFAVCAHLCLICSWQCTGTASCTSWSAWSGCGGGACGETRYCTDGIGTSSQARDCPGNCGNPPNTTDTPTPTITPIPTGNAQVRAVLVPDSAASCTDVDNGTNYFAEFVSLSPAVTPAPLNTSTDGTYTSATWTGINATSYTISDSPPSGYVLKFACWSTDIPAAQGDNLTAGVPTGGTLTWNFGYTAGTPWIQLGHVSPERRSRFANVTYFLIPKWQNRFVRQLQG